MPSDQGMPPSRSSEWLSHVRMLFTSCIDVTTGIYLAERPLVRGVPWLVEIICQGYIRGVLLVQGGRGFGRRSALVAIRIGAHLPNSLDPAGIAQRLRACTSNLAVKHDVKLSCSLKLPVRRTTWLSQRLGKPVTGSVRIQSFVGNVTTDLLGLHATEVSSSYRTARML